VPAPNAELADGTIVGQLLFWNGSDWVLSGNGGTQTLDFVNAESVNISDVLDLQNASGIRDAGGSLGQEGQSLMVGVGGQLTWADTCQGGMKQLVPPINSMIIEPRQNAGTAPAAVIYSAFTSIGQYLYTFGGNGQANQSYRYDMATGNYVPIASYPGPANNRSFSAANDGTDIYMFGGNNGTTSTNAAYKYSPASDTYTPLANMPAAMSYNTATYYNGKIYIVGGSATAATGTPTRPIYVYDVATNTYATFATALPTPGAINHQATLVGSKIYISYTVANSYVIDVSGATPVATAIAAGPTGGPNTSMIYSNNGILYFVGGLNFAANIIYTYNTATNSWANRAVTGTPLQGLSAYGTYNNTLWIIGGNNQAGTTNNIATTTFTNFSLAYLKVNDRANITTATYATEDVINSLTSAVIPAGTTIPAGMEITATVEGTRLFLLNNLTTNGSWIFIDNTCGGSGGSSSAELPDGENAGEMLFWDGTDWQLSGNGGNQTLDFVNATSVNISDTLSMENSNGIVDYFGQQGLPGQALMLNAAGQLTWMDAYQGGFKFIEPPINTIDIKTQGSTLPTTMSQSTTVTIGQYAYSFGGYYNNNSINSAYRYSLTSGGSVSSIANLPSGTTAGAMVATDGTYAYIFGGFTSVNGTVTQANSFAYRYDPTTNSYTQLANLPTATSRNPAVYYNGKVYLFGGTSTGTTTGSTRNVIIYDITSDSYTTQTNVLPLPLSYVQAQVVNDTVYLLGGYNGVAGAPATVNTAYSIDLTASTLTATTLTNMPANREYGAVHYQDGNIYYYGGRAGTPALFTYYNTMLSYEIATNSWQTLNTIPGSPTLAYPGFTSFGGTLWLFGGNSGQTSVVNSISTFTFNDFPLMYMKINDRAMIRAAVRANEDVERASDNVIIPAGTAIPANTEIRSTTEGTRLYLIENLTTTGSWVFIEGPVTSYGAGSGISIDSNNDIGVVYIDNNGNFIFQNQQGDTANSFSVTDSSDAAVLTVNTLTGAVVIGEGSTADASAVPLVLDSSSTAPANPTNGMMYYDTVTDEFRVYKAGVWESLVTVP
jgi:N-acetylneuraminic acid mutarotase